MSEHSAVINKDGPQAAGLEMPKLLCDTLCQEAFQTIPCVAQVNTQPESS